MRNDFESNYLAHHGILGMHWGRRNGPPYPLDAADHSQSEKKAGYKKSLGGGRNESLYDRKITRLERAAAASKRDANDLRKAGYKQEADAVQKVSDKNKAKAEKIRQLKADNNGRMTKGQKVVADVASAAALKSVIDTGRNVVAANAMLDGFTKIPLSTAVGKGAVQAGKVAAVAALATYGGVKLYSYAKSKKSSSDSSKSVKEPSSSRNQQKDLKNLQKVIKSNYNQKEPYKVNASTKKEINNYVKTHLSSSDMNKLKELEAEYRKDQNSRSVKSDQQSFVKYKQERDKIVRKIITPQNETPISLKNGSASDWNSYSEYISRSIDWNELLKK